MMPQIDVPTTALAYPKVLLSLAIWREARGESRDAKVGVKHVILNRVREPKGPYAHANTMVQTIRLPYQFSSFNPKDPNSSKFPMEQDPSWLECCGVVDADEPDPTGGADYYHSYPPGHPAWPAWATAGNQTARIGAFRFYRL